MRWARRLGIVAQLIVLALTSACVSARMSDHVIDNMFRDQEYGLAAERLRKGLEHQGDEGRDVLLYLMDLGLALHAAGDYRESNKVFLAADKMAEIKDYTSLAAEGATLLTSENLKSYKAEDFENVLINTYLAMNYALIGDHENALVEARLVNRKLYLMTTEGQRQYKQNAFARYLSAAIYEADRNYNDAYVDYKKAWELAPSFPWIGRDLWRMAYVLRMPDQMERWDRTFSLSQTDHGLALQALPKSGKGEIIVLYENGISPVKVPNPEFRELPIFSPRYNPVSHAQVEVDGAWVADTAVLHDVEATAIENLKEKYAGLIAKRLAGIVAKEVVSDQIARQTKSEVAGALAKLIFYASSQADLRSWNLLPRDLQVARILVDPGVKRVVLRPVRSGTLREKTVQVEAGRKVFVNFRYMP